MDYNYSYNNQPQSSGNIYGVGIMFFLFGILLTFIILYLIYEFILKENQKAQVIQPINTIIENIKKNINLTEYDLNIDDCLFLQLLRHICITEDIYTYFLDWVCRIIHGISSLGSCWALGAPMGDKTFVIAQDYLKKDLRQTSRPPHLCPLRDCSTCQRK
jgi:hypothetical protein